MSLLAALGVNFDCASRSEIDLVRSLGVASQRIVYANPCKQIDHLTHAQSVGVPLTVFDGGVEICTEASAPFLSTVNEYK